MTTLYRMADVPPEHWNKVDKDIQHFVRCGILAPVEPCAHGNYARHIVCTIETVIGYSNVWCPGSPDSETTDNQPVDREKA